VLSEIAALLVFEGFVLVLVLGYFLSKLEGGVAASLEKERWVRRWDTDTLLLDLVIALRDAGVNSRVHDALGALSARRRQAYPRLRFSQLVDLSYSELPGQWESDGSFEYYSALTLNHRRGEIAQQLLRGVLAFEWERDQPAVNATWRRAEAEAKESLAWATAEEAAKQGKSEAERKAAWKAAWAARWAAAKQEKPIDGVLQPADPLEAEERAAWVMSLATLLPGLEAEQAARRQGKSEAEAKAAREAAMNEARAEAAAAGKQGKSQAEENDAWKAWEIWQQDAEQRDAEARENDAWRDWWAARKEGKSEADEKMARAAWTAARSERSLRGQGNARPQLGGPLHRVLFLSAVAYLALTLAAILLVKLFNG
jgi:hypothetical protein